MNRVSTFISRGQLNRNNVCSLSVNYVQYDCAKLALQLSSISIKNKPGIKLNCRLVVTCNQIRGTYIENKVTLNKAAPLCMFYCNPKEDESCYFKQFPNHWFEIEGCRGQLEFRVTDINVENEALPLDHEYHLFFLVKRLD